MNYDLNCGWSLRRHYGRGAARVLVPLPRLAFETVPMRPGREVLASLSPLYLALLLPLGALLLEVNDELPRERKTQSTIELTAYETLEPELTEPEKLAASAPEPPPAPALEPQPAPSRVVHAPAPVAAREQGVSIPANAALAAIAMDELDALPPAPVSATRVRVASLARPRPNELAATDFNPVERVALPPLLPAPTSEVVLPAVSLPGKASTRTSGTALEGVAAAHVTDPLPMPQAPVVARLPEPRSQQLMRPNLSNAERLDATSSSRAQPIEGVPLASLAACRTRERENALKQELMLVATRGTRCSGPGGSYSFLETKNLNAFLLRVARDSTRELGNRCDELMRAQKCVISQGIAGVLP